MKIKTALAAMAGASAMTVTGVVLWIFTRMEVLHVAAWMLAVYAAVVAGVLLLVEKWDVTVRVRVRRRSDGPQLYDLRDYPEWREKERRGQDAGRDKAV